MILKYTKFGNDMDNGVPHRPTEQERNKVAQFACAGIAHEDIAKYLDISVPTLVKHYKSELHNARWDKLNEVAQTALQRAANGNDKMIEFVLRTQARWKNARDDDDKKNGMEALLEKLIDKL